MNILKRCFVRERVEQRSAFTTDARMHDMRLTPEVTPRNPIMTGVAGQTWVGHSRTELDAMPDDQAVKVVDAAIARLNKYLDNRGARRSRDGYRNEVGAGLSSGTMRRGGFQSLTTGSDERPPEFDVSAGTSPRSINEANDAMWNGSRTRDGRGSGLSTHATPSSIMQASRKMWMNLLGRPASGDRLAAARDVRCTNQTSPADINEMNRRFHSGTPEPSPFNRPFGRG